MSSASTTQSDSEVYTSTLSSEAYNLIQCFYDGMDRVVYRVAESIARERTHIHAPAVVRIEEQDVRQAWNCILSALRDATSPELKNALAEMSDCVNSN